MNTLLLTDSVTLGIGLILVIAVAHVLRTGLSRLWGPERVITQASARMMTSTFWLVAAAFVCFEASLLPASVPNPLCGITGDCTLGTTPASPSEIVLVVATRFGAACVAVGVLYMLPVVRGLQWRQRQPGSPTPAATAQTPS